MHIEWINSLDKVTAEQWNALFPADYPFCQYQFLRALEQGGSVGHKTGWLVNHLLLWDQDHLVGAAPAYIKMHSYGEYLFDWAFAEAYQNYGLSYYPKLLFAIPFTPAEGARLGCAAGQEPAELLNLVQQAFTQLAKSLNLSHMQCLYADAVAQAAFRESGFIERADVQFQWHNKNYQCFDDFLQTLNGRKRKQIRKERVAVQEQGLQVRPLNRDELTPAFWQQFYLFYCDTYQKRSRHNGYLTLETFRLWGETMVEQILVFAAFHQGKMVAASLCFRSDLALYGRYWGCLDDYAFLHFECCYYQGIEYCIANNLERFDAGAQGEHKLHRGFEPVLRYGFYQFTDKAEHRPINQAIADYCKRQL
jgi:predicted N-acyltransferase